MKIELIEKDWGYKLRFWYGKYVRYREGLRFVFHNKQITIPIRLWWK